MSEIDEDTWKVIAYEIDFTRQAQKNLMAKAEGLISDAEVARKKLQQLANTLSAIKLKGADWREVIALPISEVKS